MATAWIGLSAPEVVYAACGSVRPSRTPCAIIAAPVPSATRNTSSPYRTASRMLGAVSRVARRAAAVKPSPVSTMTKPPPARVIDTTVSAGVLKLKCDGTPRQACTVTSATSTTQATVKATSSAARGRRRIDSRPVAQVTEARVRPKERPKVAALRSDSGPSQVRPVTSSTVTCARPLTNSAAATR